MRTALTVIVIALATTAGALEPPRQAAPPPQKKQIESRPTYRMDLRSNRDFLAMSKQVGNERFIKFVVDLTQDHLIFFDVNVYEMHADFVFDKIFQSERTPAALYDFNQNYRRDKPMFMLGLLVHHIQQDTWTLQYSGSDQVTAFHVQLAMDHLKKHAFVGQKVRFMPDSTDQALLLPTLGTIPTVTRNTLYKQLTYRAFTAGQSVGTLRIVSDISRPETLDFKGDDIVILPGDLPDIVPVAGIISETFSTPLSHVALRARARGIPHVGLRNASKTYRKLAGKMVVLKATLAKHSLRLATPADIVAWNARSSKPKTPLLPVFDLKTTELRALKDIKATQAGAYGAKAANLGEIAATDLNSAKVPKGFGIPVRYYAQHLASAGVGKQIDTLLADPAFTSDRAVRRARLAEIRSTIRSAPIDPSLLQSVMDGTVRLGGAKRLFIRSSTNAEDLKGFSGAGLYDTVPNVTGKSAVADAVRHVWASVWNLRAYEEREAFGVDHRAVYGAVLVQVGINATAAGVLITTNLRDPTQDWIYTINANKGLGMRVVEGRRIPEQLLFNISLLSLTVVTRSDETTKLVFDPKGGVREVPISDPTAGVLSDTRAHTLAQTAQIIAARVPWKGPTDIEWLYEGEQLYIVQARPYDIAPK
ncbi:MAG: hypothetical protein ACI9OJ_004495 [Myxococcota bacterium]|jgi:hypothetical protein